MTVTELRSVLGSDEEMGYDVPFTAFTWAQWLALQARMLPVSHAINAPLTADSHNSRC